MTTVEKLFVQIFERKNWIVQQVKQQTDLYNQHLASKLLVDGITPPSWLWNDNQWSDVSKELNKEDLISEILLPHPRPIIRFPGACCSLYNKPVGEGDEGAQAGRIFTDTHSNNECIDSGNAQGVEYGCIENNPRCNMNVVHDCDMNITTHPKPISCFPGACCSPYNKQDGEGDEGVQGGGIFKETYSNNECFDNGNEQGAASGCIENNTRCNRNMMPEVDISVTSPHDETEVSISSTFSAPDQSVARIQRSKSRQKALELRNSAKTEARSRLNQQNDPVGSSLTNRLFVFSPAEDQVTGRKELGEPGRPNLENCGGRETHEGDIENNKKEKVFNSCTGKFSRSRGCKKQPISAMDLVKTDSSAYTFKKNHWTALKDAEDFPQCSGVLNLSREVVNSDVTAEDSGFLETTLTEDCFSHMEKKSETCGERISRPRAFLDEASERDIPDDFAMVDDGITAKSPGKSVQQFGDANDFLALTEHSVGLVHDEVRSQTMSGDEGMPKLLDTSIVAGHAETKSICGAAVTTQAAKDEAWNSSDGQVILAPHDSHDAANQLRKFETVACDVTFNDKPAISRSISRGASLDCSLTRSSSDYLVFVEPKQLVFDEREECNFRDKSNLTVECEKLEISPGKVFDASSHPPSSSDHGTSSGDMIHHKLSTVGQEFSTKEVDVGVCYFNKNIREHDDVRIKAQGSNTDEYSVPKNIMFDSEALPYVSNSKFSCPVDIIQPNLIVEGPDTENHANLNCKELCEPELQDEGSFIRKESTSASHTFKSKLFMASAISSSAEKAIGECSIEEVGTLSPTNILIGPEGQYCVEGNQNLSYLGSKPCSGYASNVSSTQQVLESSSLRLNNMHTRGSVGSPLADLSESRELQISKKSVVQNLRSLGMDSWPRSKRRKIQDKETDCFSASPSFRVKKHPQSQMESASVKKAAEDAETVPGVASTVNESFRMEVYQNMALQLTKEMGCSPKLQTEEFASTSEDLGERAEATSSSSLNQVGDLVIFNLTEGIARCSQGCLVEETKLAGTSADATEDNDQEDHLHWLHLDGKGNLANGESLMMERNHLHGKSHLQLDGHIPGDLGWPLSKGDLDLTLTDQTMPVLEGFIIDPPTEHDEVKVPGHAINFDELELPRTSIERASILEQICTSTISQTPLTQFSSALKLNEYNKFCHSVPNGLLECMNLRSISAFNEDAQKQLRFSYMHNANVYPLQEMSYSDSLPGFGARSGLYSRNVSTSPVGKLWERMALHTGSSEKRLSSNPELTCFPIEEDPSSTDENENASEVTEKIQEDNNSFVDTCPNREPLANITEENARMSISAVEKSVNRASLDSITTEVIFKGTYKKVKPKIRSYSRKNGEGKENEILTVAANAIKNAKESTTNRFRKTRSSRKTSLKREMRKLSEKEPKCNNIVSNVTSFIPLVKQKQAAAVCTGKRDVKVKALEIAEAAKRLEAKKENERKMRKEALKLERARMEQENLRLMELTKKKKEEERKKRDADIATKKRQREEEERKEKERKRKRIEETQRMRREEGTLCTQKVEKEKQFLNIDDKDLKTKESDNRSQKSHNLVKEIRDGMTVEKRETLQKPDDFTFQASISIETCATSRDSCEHVKANAASDRTGKTDNMIVQKIEEKSYEISPYHCSDDDDDDEEEEEERNQKFIPSWASKNCVALVLPLQQGVQPDLIFPPESFCRIDEVCPSPKAKRVIKMKGQR